MKCKSRKFYNKIFRLTIGSTQVIYALFTVAESLLNCLINSSAPASTSCSKIHRTCYKLLKFRFEDATKLSSTENKKREKLDFAYLDFFPIKAANFRHKSLAQTCEHFIPLLCGSRERKNFAPSCCGSRYLAVLVLQYFISRKPIILFRGKKGRRAVK